MPPPSAAAWWAQNEFYWLDFGLCSAVFVATWTRQLGDTALQNLWSVKTAIRMQRIAAICASRAPLRRGEPINLKQVPVVRTLRAVVCAKILHDAFGFAWQQETRAYQMRFKAGRGGIRCVPGTSS